GTIALTDTTITGNGGAAIALYLGAVLEGLTGLTVGGNGSNVVWYRTREISSNERWKSFGLPYLLTDGWFYVRGASSPVLTIEPGVEVRFNGGIGMSIGDQQPGGLVAVGTLEKPIKFTSNAATVAPRQWRGLYFGAQTSSGTRIENGVIEGAGEGGDGGVMVVGGAPALRAVTVRRNGASAIRVYGGAPTIAGCLLQGSRDWDALGLDARGGTLSLMDTTITGNAGAAIALYLGAVLEGLTGLTVGGNGSNVVWYRTREISSNERWKSFGLPYVLTDGWFHVRGASSPVLTIEPGVEVRFNGGLGMSIGSQQPGELVAVGTPERPIKFTSNAATVAPRQWRGLYIEPQSSAGTRIENAVIEGAGEGGDGGVMVDGGAPALRAVTVRSNGASAIRVYGGAPTIAGCLLQGSRDWDAVGLDAYGGTVTLTDTTITGNAGAAIALWAGAALEGLTGLTVADNAGGNIVRYRSTEIPTSQTWKSFGLPYVPDGSFYVRGAASPVLRIEPGVEVRFNGGAWISVGYQSPGGLVAVGTAEQPIRFTSNATTVSPGHWGRITFNAATAAGSRIENAVVEGGGYFSDGSVVVYAGTPVFRSVTFQKNRGSGLRVDGGSPTIFGCEIREGTERGLWLLGGSMPRVIGNTITGNAGAGIQNESSRATIRFNTISGNGGYGMLSSNGAFVARDNSVTSNGAPARNDDTASRTLDVRQQWWGAETPPTGLVGRVQYDPWLGSPPTPPFAVSSFERSTAAFNPEGAGVTFAFELPSPGSWTLTLADAGGSVVRSFSGNGLSASVLWDGRDEGGVSLPDGVFSYRFTAMEPASSITAAPLLGRVTLDRTLPLALLAAPLPGAAVVSPVGISGTAAGSGFAAYTLEYGVGEHPATMTLIDRGSLPVTEGSLGLWSALLTEPHYTLRLTVTASGGKVATQSLTVRLDGQTACQ
nr:right-handed parallel beta-helix repeat-containing protein [Thermoanaerobaculia bacterium]